MIQTAGAPNLIDADNEPWTQAWRVLTTTDKNVFITGPAGTGKSTLLTRFLADPTTENWQKVVLAPTGVAALNVGGETIHHFLRLGPAATRQDAVSRARQARKRHQDKLYTHLDIVIIDEISMVRADMFDMLDVFLRTVRGSQLPFGGVRLICFGDLYQLPPVVQKDEEQLFSMVYQSSFFFSSDVFGRLIREQLENNVFLILEKIYRQHDEQFIRFLGRMRHQQLTDDDLALINARVDEFDAGLDFDESYIALTTTRARADGINRARLAQLPAHQWTFSARVQGNFAASSCPTDDKLCLKAGARVMLVNNDTDGRWVNGSIGKVTQIYPQEKSVGVILDDNLQEVRVGANTWEAQRSVFNPATGQIRKEVVGQFKQLPLKLAWAITIHKSQGKTFDKLIIDLGYGAFAAGQTYVALSRATTMSGIRLVRPLRHSDVHYDDQVTKFIEAFFHHDDGAREAFLSRRVVGHDDGEQETIF